MSPAVPRQTTGHSVRRRLGLALAVATVISGLSGQAFADDRTGALAPGNTTAPAGAEKPSADGGGPVAVARAKAKKTGKPVTVEELTTQTSLTVANPDGTLTRTDHHQPTRVKKNGSWTAVDATLAKNADGSWSPKAAASGVQLSGGGTGPLATFTDAKGRSLSLTLPFALPAPTVNGDSVQYTGVLPGVDLKATVTDQGAFREVLVVHDAKAAANPALKQLRLATTAHGLATSADQDGNITAKAEDGTAVFTAPAPVMWDSAAAQTPRSKAQNAPAAEAPQAPGEAAQAAAAKSARAAAADRAVVDGADTSASSEKGPGRSAHLSAIKVAADATGLTLTPDEAQLTSPDTAWPVFIDPYVSPATGGTNHYTEVKEGCPSQKLYDQAQSNGEGIGYQQYDSNCFGIYRSFYEFNISNLNSRMVISKSTLYFTETYGADNGCNNTWPVTLKLTGAIDGNTVWPGPGVVSTIGTQSVKSASTYSGCGNRAVNFDVTGTVQQWKTNGNLTFGLYGNESKYSSNYGLMRFSTNPYVETVFDIAPNVPDQLGTTPATACGGGWIGETGSTNGKSNITMNARLTTDMSGVNLWAQYHLWDNMVNNGSGSPADAGWPASGWVANGSTVYTNVGGMVSDGHQYGWNVSAQDGTLGSAGSGYCYFSVDLSAPTVPIFTDSTVFPPLGSSTAPTGHAGDTGITVKVTANDPTPTGCNLSACVSSGISRFEYSLDSNIPGNGAASKPATQTGGGNATANIPIDVNSTQWGTHTLFVRAVDAAGNTQGTVAQYSFFAPWNPATQVIPGDLTTDGIPDLAATTNDGNLVLVRGNADPAATPEQASTPATSPDATGWNNYLIAHRGSATTTVDDLFAFNKSTHKLYLYKNDALTGGTPGHFSDTSNVTQILTSETCPAKGSDGTWNNVSQILAPGKLALYSNAPDLITVDKKELWYYPGTKMAGCFLNTGVKIGTGDWSNVTLLAPGTVNGVPTLWARNNVTGAISSFPLTFDANHVPTTSITAPTRAPLVSGIKDTAGNNMCLDINGASTADGTPAQMYTCNNTDAQNATLGTDGSIHLLGKCLDVSNGDLGNNAAIQLWTCNNTGAQKWVPGPFAGSLLNPQSGRCLADPAGSNTPKTQLILWDCLTDNAEQIWAATAVNKALPAAQPVLPVGVGDRLSPTVASPGDVNGDGYPDLYATSANGEITRIPGVQLPAAQATDRWKLAGTTDTVRGNDLTLNGGAAITADATRGNVLTLPGTTGYANSTLTSVDTSKSYTVSAWIKTNDLANTAAFVDQSGANGVGYQLYYSAGAHSWAFGRTVDDSTSGTFSAVYGPTTGALAPQAGVWTHLTGIYDATTKQFQLYVNGSLANTAAYSGTNWNATGQVQLGRRVMPGGTFAQYANGAVSDVVVVPGTLPATITTATALMTDTAQFGAPVVLGNVHKPTDRWKLTDATDSVRTNTLTVSGTAGFVDDTTRGSKVLAVTGGSDGLAATGGQVLDTSKSYSVSAWAYLANTNDYSTVVAQSGTSVSAFYLQYSKAFNAWTFVSPSSDSTSPASYPAAFAKTPPQLNHWTHLVATYDAPSQTMSLYVDGKLAGTAVNSTPWASTGPLTIGSAKNGNYLPGRISDVQTWNTALSPSAVASLNSDQPVLTQLA